MDRTRSGESRAAAPGAAAVAFLGAALALHPLLEPDVFWHLASGRWILQHGAVPRTDPFSWVAPGSAWHNFQWLFDVGLVTAWRWGGPDALVLGKAAAFAALGALLVAAARAAGAGAWSAAGAAALALLASAERTTERPEVATYVLLAGFALVVERAYRGAPRRELAALPALTALWINLHSLAFLGPALLLWHAALAWRTSRRLARDLGLAGAASAVALLANPYGLHAWSFPLTLFRRVGVGPEVFARILEFAPPLQSPGDPALRFFWAMLVVTALALAAVRPFPWRRALAVLPFLALALLARRNIPLFAIAVAPALAAAAAARFPRAGARTVVAAAAVVVAVAVAVLRGASPALLGLSRERGLGVMPGIFPEDCLAAAGRLGVDGRLFHDLDFGGYVVWRDPARRVFLDGRLEVAGPERLAEYIAAHEDPAAWRALRARHDPEWLLLQHASRGSAAFLRALLDGGEWRALCFSPEATLLVRADRAAGLAVQDANRSWDALLAEARGPAPHAGHALDALALPLDRALRPDPAPSAIRRAARWANLQLTLGRVAAARAGFEAVLAVAPDDPEALFNRGLCALRAGDPDEARRLWTEALPRVGRANRPLFEKALRELVG